MRGGLATKAIHAGFDRDPDHGATAVPIVQTASYAHESARDLADIFAGRSPGHVYTRISNPTNLALERRIAELEGGLGALVTASGMAAISTTLLALCGVGTEVVAARGIFGGTVSFLERVMKRFGVETRWVYPADNAAVRSAVGPKTAMLFTETITNPTIDLPDLSAWSAIAAGAGVPLVVDATATTPVLARGKDLGADLVVHSTTKYVNGHGTAIGGVLVDTGRFDWRATRQEAIAELARRAGKMAFLAYARNVVLRDHGGCAAPQNSSLMLQGIESLPIRMERHCANALALAQHLEAHPAVPWVRYPGLASSPYRPLAERQFGGRGGGIVCFGVPKGADPVQVLDRFRLAKRMTNLGDARTLVLHPGSTIFAEYTPEQKAAMGVPDDLVRVSVGIEDIEDITADFDHALAG